MHGLTLSSDMFVMPEIRNLASYLLDDGFTDVWALDFRMSNRFPYDGETHAYTLDDIADYDFPAAIEELRKHVGDRRVHVVAHCLGLAVVHDEPVRLPAAGHHQRDLQQRRADPARVGLVTREARLRPADVPVRAGTRSPGSEVRPEPEFTRDWAVARLVDLAHRECDVSACHMLSFMWGSGRPAMYEHDNLEPVTHERMADICSSCGTSYYRHVGKMVRAGDAVRFDPSDRRDADLPDDYLTGADNVTTAILLLTGDRNRVFTDSNIVCHELISKRVQGPCELEIPPGYGHLDPFIGKNSHRDVFPLIGEFLRRQAH